MDPTQKKKVVSQIGERVSDLSPKQKRAAKYILDNSYEFGLDPIRLTAEKARVSTYTLIKLAHILGFESFEEMRNPFRHALIAEKGASIDRLELGRLTSDDPLGQVHNEAVQNALSVIHNSLSRATTEKLELAVNAMFSARRVYVMGIRASFSLAHYFNYVVRMALKGVRLIPQHMNGAIDDLSTSSSKDVLFAITFSPYSAETIQACSFAKERGATVILLSDTVIFDPEMRPDIAFVVSTISTHHFSTYSGGMAFLECLLAMIFYRGGEEAADRVRDYQELRTRFNAYWPGPSKKNKSFQ